MLCFFLFYVFMFVNYFLFILLFVTTGKYPWNITHVTQNQSLKINKLLNMSNLLSDDSSVI